jgi:hypothetical protein
LTGGLGGAFFPHPENKKHSKITERIRNFNCAVFLTVSIIFKSSGKFSKGPG